MRVEDDEHPRLFAFCLFVGALRSWRLVGFGVEPKPSWVDELTVTEIRALPILQWKRAAQAEADRELYARMVTALRNESKPVPPATMKEPPSLDDLLGETSLLKRVAREYVDWVNGGAKSPAAEIANDHNVKVATARQWIYRARRAGYLPAASRGRQQAPKETR